MNDSAPPVCKAPSLGRHLHFHPQVPTAGLLNIVGAPQLAADSTYVASYTSKRSRRYKTAKSGEVVAAAALAQEAMGYSPVVRRRGRRRAGAE